MQKYGVIMAGGGGTRFWPLSRQQKPKQLLNISGNDTMINESIKRVLKEIPIENVLVVTNKKQGELINKLILDELPRENILLEPVGRNTSACIAYAAMVINSRCSDAVMCVIPSDHYIEDEYEFAGVLSRACELAENSQKLITIGIKPTFPSTGYGYIRYNSSGIEGAYEVEEFVEKPSAEKAREYCKSGNYLWNSGMFIWKVSTIIDSLHRYIPRLYKTMRHINEIIGTQTEQEAFNSAYSSLQNISIDFAVLERSDDVLVIPGNFGWSDIGSWDTLGAIFPTDEDGNIVKAKHVGYNTRNSIIYSSDRLIATIGLDNLIIADTPDALLICPKNRAQEVKRLVEMIEKDGLRNYI